MRVTPSVDLKEFEAKLHQMCAQAGDGVTLTFLQVIARNNVNLLPLLLLLVLSTLIYFQQMKNTKVTSIDPSDPWFSAFSAACKIQFVKNNHKQKKSSSS